MLHKAALEGDWNRCRAALGASLSALSPEQQLTLAEASIADALPGFFRHHPNDTWVRAALDEQTRTPAPEYAGPGGNNVVHAVEALQQCRAASGDAARRAHAEEVVASSIMARLVECWGRHFPERWQQWITATPEARTRFTTLIDFRAHPAVQALERALWLETEAWLLRAQGAPGA